MFKLIQQPNHIIWGLLQDVIRTCFASISEKEIDNLKQLFKLGESEFSFRFT